MRLAVVGSGGTGKSVIAGTLARLLARRGRQVLAVDLDSNPGLAWSLGAARSDVGVPDELLADGADTPYGWDLASGIKPADALERSTVRAPDGVRLLSVRKIDGVDNTVRRTIDAVRHLCAAAPKACDVIGDLEAGMTTPYEGHGGFADRVLLVVGPSWRSALTARRILALYHPHVATTVVANQCIGDSHPDRHDLPMALQVPHDPAVADAERRGRAPLDDCPDSPAVAAIGALATTLIDQEATV